MDLSKDGTYIVVGIAFFILFMCAMVLGVNGLKRKNRLDILDQYHDRNSTLKALPVQYLLNKVALMPKNQELTLQYENWEKIYNKLANEESASIKEALNSVEQVIYARQFSKASHELREIETVLNRHEAEYENLLKDLTNATQVDVKNREEIVSQKEMYRNFNKMFQSNFDNYKPFNNAIEKYLKNIEASFTAIDSLLNNSEVEQARNLGATLEGDLLKMKDILSTLPELVSALSKDLPNELKDVENLYNNVVKKKYTIAHLDIPNRLHQVNKMIVTALERNNEVFLKDLVETRDEAKAILKLADEELKTEELANDQLDHSLKEMVNDFIELDARRKYANKELEDVKQRYILTENEIANMQMQNELVDEFMMEKMAIVAMHENNTEPASAIQKRIDNLIPKARSINAAIDAYTKRMEEIRSDEKRIRDEYDNMSYIIKDCEASLREMRLPMLSNAYNDTIQAAKASLKKVVDELEHKPLDVEDLLQVISDTRENVYKLYDNSRNLLKTAQMAENTIIFANRYRLRRPEINKMLGRAEAFFNTGEYTKSLSTAIEAAELIYPSIRKELLQYKTNQLKSTPIFNK